MKRFVVIALGVIVVVATLAYVVNRPSYDAAVEDYVRLTSDGDSRSLPSR